MRRTARLGDGWFPAANNPKFRINNPVNFKTRLDVLKIICEEEGRDMSELDLGFFYTGTVASQELLDVNGSRQVLTGKASDIAQDINNFGAAGLNTMIFRMERPNLSETLDLMDWFGAEVIPLLNTQ
jgi:hypothetical protein